MLSNLNDGYIIVAFREGVREIFRKKDDKIYGSNIDLVDENTFESNVSINEDLILFAQECSERRYHLMREVQYRKTQMQVIQNEMQFQQVMDAAKKGGMRLSGAPKSEQNDNCSNIHPIAPKVHENKKMDFTAKNPKTDVVAETSKTMQNDNSDGEVIDLVDL